MILCEIISRKEKIKILDLKFRFRINQLFSKIYQISTENYFICENKQKIRNNKILFSFLRLNLCF